ncbi:hypothetical protein D3C78_419460 [compost metagenome]
MAAVLARQVQAFGVEGVHRQQVFALGCGADIADQVVQHQWIGRGGAVERQHHVRLVLAQGLDVGDAQFFAGKTEPAQAEILRQRIVLAIGGTLDQGFDGRGPVIGLLPDARVVLEIQLLIEEAVHRVELLTFGRAACTLQHLTPRLDPVACRSRRAVAFFHGLQDLRKIPVGPDAVENGQ